MSHAKNKRKAAMHRRMVRRWKRCTSGPHTYDVVPFRLALTPIEAGFITRYLHDLSCAQVPTFYLGGLGP